MVIERDFKGTVQYMNLSLKVSALTKAAMMAFNSKTQNSQGIIKQHHEFWCSFIYTAKVTHSLLFSYDYGRTKSPTSERGNWETQFGAAVSLYGEQGWPKCVLILVIYSYIWDSKKEKKRFFIIVFISCPALAIWKN